MQARAIHRALALALVLIGSLARLVDPGLRQGA